MSFLVCHLCGASFVDSRFGSAEWAFSQHTAGGGVSLTVADENRAGLGHAECLPKHLLLARLVLVTSAFREPPVWAVGEVEP